MQRQREKDGDKELDICKAWVAQLVINKTALQKRVIETKDLK